MKTSLIRQRVADFLKQHAPFDMLPPTDLLELASSGRVKFHQSEEVIHQKDEGKLSMLWVIQQGKVELYDGNEDTARLTDVLGEGDVLGLDRFSADGRCEHAARTTSDVILYGMDAILFENVVARNPLLQRFISARVSMSSALGWNRRSWLETPAPPLGYLKARLAQFEGDTALLPSLEAPLSTRLALRTMLATGQDQMAVLEAGSAVGLLTASELGLFVGHHPIALLKAIVSAQSSAELEPLLRLFAGSVQAALAEAHDIDDCCRLTKAGLQAIASACIRLAAEEAQASGLLTPSLPFCWICFGDAARGDLMQPSFPTIAAIYDDLHPLYNPADRKYFLVVAEKVAHWLQESGLSGDLMCWPEGANPAMALSDWKRLYSDTIQHPLDHDLYTCRGFFDIQLLTGEPSILTALQVHIAEAFSKESLALALLANDTLSHVPPLTFFEGLVVGIDGARSESFDIDAAILSPIADAARVYALATGNFNTSGTLSRLQQSADSALEAMEAFRVALYYRTLEGAPHIAPSRLGKLDQNLIKSALNSTKRFLEATFQRFTEPA
jgi:signal-transduction protein with cAMP-binding, CBS, and nucleotidyltransferase domain